MALLITTRTGGCWQYGSWTSVIRRGRRVLTTKRENIISRGRRGDRKRRARLTRLGRDSPLQSWRRSPAPGELPRRTLSNGGRMKSWREREFPYSIYNIYNRTGLRVNRKRPLDIPKEWGDWPRKGHRRGRGAWAWGAGSGGRGAGRLACGAGRLARKRHSQRLKVAPCFRCNSISETKYVTIND